MRLIDADALMQSLGITDMDCDKCAWHDNERNECKRGGDFVDACCAIEDAPTVEPKTMQWIPCSERLPEEDGCLYLVTVYAKTINRRRIFVSRCYVNNDGFWSDLPLGYKVIAWTPLPELYMGEKDETD